MPSPVSMTRSSPTRMLQGKIFDRAVKAHHRARPMDMERMSLHRALAEQMLERRCFIKQQTPVVLEIGAHCGWYLHHLCNHPEQSKNVKQYIQCDVSAGRLSHNYENVKGIIPPTMELVQMECDEEVSIPVPDKSVDMVVSCLSMHWVNDLEKAMINIRRVLKQDGFMLMCMLGGNTLFEMRSAFSLAEQERDGGFSAHTNPMIDGAGMSTLLLQSGFHFPTIDMDRHRLDFPSMFHAAEYLQDMGESTALLMRRPYVPPATFVAAAAMYDYLYKVDGLVPATFEVFHALGWAPSPAHPVHLSERGSAQISLQALRSEEHTQFQTVLEELGQDPENEELMAKAEALLDSLKKEQVEGKGPDLVPAPEEPLSVGPRGDIEIPLLNPNEAKMDSRKNTSKYNPYQKP